MQAEQLDIREHLRRHPPFSLLSDDWLNTLASRVEVAYFRAGSTILQAGDPIEDLHYIRSGGVEIYRHEGELYNRLGEGEIFGQLGLLMKGMVRFPARALEDTLIYFIPGDLFRALFDQVGSFATFVEIEDRTRLRQATANEGSRNELMTTRVGRLITRAPVTVSERADIRTAAAIMTEQNVSSVLVVPESGDEGDPRTTGGAMAGIITDRDLRRRVVAQGLPYDTPVRDIMSSDVVTVQDDQYLFEALLIMLRENVHHLPVMHRLKPIGLIDLSDIISHETQNSLFVVRNIFHQQSVEALQALVPEVKASFVRMVNEDANSHMVGSAMATIGRSFKQHLLQLGEQKLGPPPVPYCFLALGSMARDEQYLRTDQDNALVLDDSFVPAEHDAYFEALAHFVCDGLATVGYTYCKGDIMATNPTWRQPLHVWQHYFTDWIRRPSAQSLLNSSIFFDLDGVHGDTHMADQLQALIADEASKTPGFLGCLARNAQNRTPPLGFFKDFVVEKSGRHRNSINLKRRGTAPLVDVIRVHALASGSRAQNSFRRLEDTVAAGFLTAQAASDLRDALEFISLVRIRHQARDIEAGREPVNNIDPEQLSSFERRNLKDAFQVLSNAQRFLKFRYRPQSTR
ncbi:cyclic nucleotide-binding/CBS domain-containing protein [Natronospirillum operosum]|uniref:Cyclic nucleotide-binding/CBS domain-containing protein n=1 Tax=Natronospirillum operosum TaxID=2759953 RepID=A0A4Z0WCJ7_9GAMM|nr:putative nucleotidyltransferase substrate binding domain-containing protein [Natronospirillum operosum]TGG92101.1 cyclic nucleotide-binding/CBS domain-containing protein [Natronospirillum operosum]